MVGLGMTPEVSIAAAFIAGVLSITSPCVLPLIPLYLAHLAGSTDSIEAGAERVRRRTLVVNAFSYVAGFSLVFVLIGVAFGAAGTLVSTAEIVSSNRFWLVRRWHDSRSARTPPNWSDPSPASEPRAANVAGGFIWQPDTFVVPRRSDVRCRLVAMRRTCARSNSDDGRRRSERLASSIPSRDLFGRTGGSLPRDRLIRRVVAYAWRTWSATFRGHERQRSGHARNRTIDDPGHLPAILHAVW